MLGIGAPNIVFKRGGGFSFTFTSAGATGSAGPSLAQCQTAYAGQTFLTGSFSLVGGKQLLTITTAGTYRIIAKGAGGGAKSTVAGGNGATMQGDFTLAVGDVIQMLVGQRGVDALAGDGNSNGGGGGGSFVLKNGIFILTAGGGGGGGKYSTNPDGPGKNASTGSNGVQGAANSGGNGGTGGSGGASSNILYGTGGGGYLGAGASNGGYGTGGASYIVSGLGGTGYSGQGNGGFGGGGGGGFAGAGGGGGYSGGGSGWYLGGTQGAGGGGSYNTGASQVNTIQLTNSTGSIQIIAI